MDPHAGWSCADDDDTQYTAGTGLEGGGSFVDIGDPMNDLVGPAASIVLHGVITLAAADTLKFQCRAGGDGDGDEIEDSVITAVKVGSVTFP